MSKEPGEHIQQNQRGGCSVPGAMDGTGEASGDHWTCLPCARDVSEGFTVLIERTGLMQSNVSNHLACLRDCGLVIASRQQRYTLYQLSDERVATLLSLADALLAETAQGVDACPRYEQKEECC